MPRQRRTQSRRRHNISSLVRKEVKSQITSDMELKNVHFPYVTTPLTAPVYKELINDLFIAGQGTDVDQFIGSQIRIKRMNLRWSIAQADTTNNFRMVIFETRRDYEPAAGDTVMFKEPSHQLLSPLNYDFVKRVYVDRTLFLGGTNSGSVSLIKRGRKHINMRNRKCLFQVTGAGAVVADVKLYVMVVSDSSVAPSPRFTLLSSLHYTDS